MAQISRRKLSKEIEKRIYHLLFNSLASLSKASNVERFLLDLLSPTEITMLAKRLSIAILLSKGFSYDLIKETLKVSQGTISQVNKTLNSDHSGYKIVVSKAIQDQRLSDLFNKVEENIAGVLPNSNLKGSLVKRSITRRIFKTNI